MGDILSDLNTRRGRVQGMNTEGAKSVITAQVPQSELFTYATELRSLTGGRGTFSSSLDRYDEMPAHLAEKIIEAHRKEQESGGH